MPYRIKQGASETSGAPSTFPLHITLWPHQSLTPKGFVIFMGCTAAAFALPLLAVVGTMALWFLLPFIGLTMALVWAMLHRSWADGTLREDVTLTPEHISILRTNPRSPEQSWEANPFWVRPVLHPKPVENYLTLTGGDREVELGRFLTPEERVALHRTLTQALQACKAP